MARVDLGPITVERSGGPQGVPLVLVWSNMFVFLQSTRHAVPIGPGLCLRGCADALGEGKSRAGVLALVVQGGKLRLGEAKTRSTVQQMVLGPSEVENLEARI